MSQLVYKEDQANVEELIEQASQGEEVIIESRDGRRYRLVEVEGQRPRPKFGSARGQVRTLDGFDDPIEGLEEYM